jgi:hypothetical protein
MTLNELLNQYSLSSLIILIIGLLAVIKYVFELIKWFVTGSRNFFKKESDKEQEQKKINQKIADNETSIKKLIEMNKSTEQKVVNLSSLIQILIDSDKDDIKSWITEKHHYFCYELGYIDDYNYQCIEARYKHYKEEKGNTFIDGFMTDIRALPKVSVVKKKEDK